MSIQFITAKELKGWLEQKRKMIVIDVMPPESFEIEHLPGAQNACVYQIDFLDQVKNFANDPLQTIVLYGSSPDNLASSVAAEKLISAGFQDVRECKGGMYEWRKAGCRIEGTDATLEEPTIQDGIYRLDTEKSMIEWTGRNIGGKHAGTINLSAGEVTVDQGKVTRGQFVIDMRTLRNTDIEDLSMRSVLVQHLMSDDFFEVEKYPTAGFAISNMVQIEASTPGTPNYRVLGELKIKNIERKIEFPAVIGLNNGTIVAQGNFDIDRTLWNVVYGSGRLFEHLGMHLVNDLVSIQLKIVVKP